MWHLCWHLHHETLTPTFCLFAIYPHQAMTGIYFLFFKVVIWSVSILTLISNFFFSFFCFVFFFHVQCFQHSIFPCSMLFKLLSMFRMFLFSFLFCFIVQWVGTSWELQGASPFSSLLSKTCLDLHQQITCLLPFFCFVLFSPCSIFFMLDAFNV